MIVDMLTIVVFGFGRLLILAIRGGNFTIMLMNEPTHIFSDFIFPSCTSNSDEYIYCIFHTDMEPGLNINGENDNLYDVRFAKIPKDEIVGININKENPGFDVSQNFPNPFSQTTAVKVSLKEPTTLTLEVRNMLGQKVMQTQSIIGKQGVNHITIEKNNLMPSIYFYKVQSGEQVITKKMIID